MALEKLQFVDGAGHHPVVFTHDGQFREGGTGRQVALHIGVDDDGGIGDTVAHDLQHRLAAAHGATRKQFELQGAVGGLLQFLEQRLQAVLVHQMRRRQIAAIGQLGFRRRAGGDTGDGRGHAGRGKT